MDARESDVRRRVATCFVAIDSATHRIAGYYTLSAGSISLASLPEPTAKKLPRYPHVPVVRIGRLAVDREFQGKKLGSALLFDALVRSLDSEIAAFAAVIDAKDEAAVQFYERHGFEKLSSDGKLLFLPLSDSLRRLAAP